MYNGLAKPAYKMYNFFMKKESVGRITDVEARDNIQDQTTFILEYVKLLKKLTTGFERNEHTHNLICEINA